ncbi:preprotein translocase subunit SecE [Sulfurihydrogenibium sp.]|jgi:preprotein translocase subunit SecE|uniref:preprotein translocase subunit SecE n=1 Tax=Sulfurihydrogenibium sp. TaxID=2053621 RepID=UPI0026319972|nr:preprotein translocase subunit SecE [Sulfurihydrogenibium sp.]
MVKYLNFLKEVFEELKKVTWPSKDLVKTATIAVIVLTLIMALYLWGLDILFTKIIAFIIER